MAGPLTVSLIGAFSEHSSVVPTVVKSSVLAPKIKDLITYLHRSKRVRVGTHITASFSQLFIRLLAELNNNDSAWSRIRFS